MASRPTVLHRQLSSGPMRPRGGCPPGQYQCGTSSVASGVPICCPIQNEQHGTPELAEHWSQVQWGKRHPSRQRVGLGAWALDTSRAHLQGEHVRVPIHGVGAVARLTIHRGIGRRRRTRPSVHTTAMALPKFVKARQKAKEAEAAAECTGIG